MSLLLGLSASNSFSALQKQYLPQFLFRFTNMFTVSLLGVAARYLPFRLNYLFRYFFFNHQPFFMCSVVLIIFTSFCGRSPQLFHLTKLKLCTHFCLPLPTGIHNSTLCFHEFEYFGNLISVDSYSISRFVTGLFYLT